MITIEKTQRITKILADGKHVKSFPLSTSHCLNELTESVCNKFEKGLRMQDNDVELTKHFIFPVLPQDFYIVLQKEEKYVFEIIANSQVVGCREVISKNGNRFELCFDNGTKVRIDELLFKFAIDKLPTAYLNY